MPDVTHHSRTIYKTQPSSSGQIEYVSTGCAQLDENIVKTTALATLKNYGVSILSATAPVSYVLAAPRKGVSKVIRNMTTHATKIKGSTGHTVRFGTSKATVINFAAATTKMKAHGRGVALRGFSTVQWYIEAMDSTAVGTVTTTT
jgi:hypothetical protein